jgi:uncharacterized protein (DUF3820 family)
VTIRVMARQGAARLATRQDWPRGKIGHKARLATRQDWPQGKIGHQARLATRQDWPRGKIGHKARLATRQDWPQGKIGRKARLATRQDWPQGKVGHKARLATRQDWPQGKIGHKARLATRQDWPLARLAIGGMATSHGGKIGREHKPLGAGGNVSHACHGVVTRHAPPSRVACAHGVVSWRRDETRPCLQRHHGGQHGKPCACCCCSSVVANMEDLLHPRHACAQHESRATSRDAREPSNPESRPGTGRPCIGEPSNPESRPGTGRPCIGEPSNPESRRAWTLGQSELCSQ